MSTFAKWLVGSTVAVVLLLLALAGAGLWTARNQALDQAEREAANLAQAVSGQIGGTLTSLDQALFSIRQGIDPTQLPDAVNRRALTRFLEVNRQAEPGVLTVSVIDA